MKRFCINYGKGISVVVSEDDVLGIIGELLSAVSQMDPNDLVVITCYDDFGKEGVNNNTEG